MTGERYFGNERGIIPTANVFIKRKESDLTDVIIEMVNQGLSFEAIVAELKKRGVEESDLTDEQRELLNRVAHVDGKPKIQPPKVQPTGGMDTGTDKGRDTSNDKEDKQDPDLTKAIEEEKKKKDLDNAMEEELNKQDFYTRMTKLVSGAVIVISVAYFLTKK